MKSNHIKHVNRNGCLKLIFFVMILSLQSCFVAKKYVRPNMSVASDYRGFKADDTTTIAKIPWEVFFKDQQLKSLINKALDSNYNVRIAFQNILKAEALYKRGKARYLPAVNFDASVTSTDFAENSALGQQFAGIGNQGGGSLPNRIEQYDATVSAVWEADIWGRITSLKDAEFASFLQADVAVRAIQTRLIADLATLYYQLQVVDAQLIIADRTVKTRKKSLQTIQQLKESGQTTEVAVKQNESQLLTAEILSIELRQRIKLLENAISVLVAISPNEISRNLISTSEWKHIIEVGIPVQLLRNRPDVVQAEYNLIRAFQLKNAAKASFYPRLTLTGEAGFQSLAVSNWFNSNSFFNNLIGGLTQPIFNRREIKTQFEIREAEQKQALLRFRQTILNAEREVSDALINYQAEKDKIVLRGKQLTALSQAEEYSNKLLSNGYANYLEVLRTTDEKLAVEIELLNTQLSVRTAEIELYRALGGGWNMK